MRTAPAGVSIRPMSAADDVDRLIADDPRPAMWHLWRDLDTESMPISWLVACLDGEPQGLAALVAHPVAIGGFGAAQVTVRDQARRRGLATALRAAVEEAARGVVPGVVYRFVEDCAPAVAAVAAWGLPRGPVHHESVLDLTALDRETFAGWSAVPGVEVEPLPDLTTLDEMDWRRLHAFVVDRLREAPDSADGGGALPYEVFRTIVQQPWMLMTASRDGELIGVTMVVRRAGGEFVNTFFTGVSPEARGRGIARALKAGQALTMADLGLTHLFTQNMAGNESILTINAQLGFVAARNEVEVPVALPVAPS